MLWVIIDNGTTHSFTMSLRLSFHGAARQITGSCFRLQTDRGQVLIDCCLFQGSKSEKELNYCPLPFSPKEISAVILSRAHIDYSGLLPKLVKGGFRGPIYATPATVDLDRIVQVADRTDEHIMPVLNGRVYVFEEPPHRNRCKQQQEGPAHAPLERGAGADFTQSVDEQDVTHPEREEQIFA